MNSLRKQESPADRILPACSGFPASLELVGFRKTRSYFGAEPPEDGVVAELLLVPSDGAIAPLLLPSVAGAMVADGVVAAGAEAGGGVLSVLLQAESTSAAARALRASFVFIDESPELYERS
ncbi:MAG TPA: hypothetical protein VNZ06_05320 [Steroidobacteraceae bacterium]|jgi:hypothetical protein|nr:hypothetical protein [Steroidobacteraceae bacterium]